MGIETEQLIDRGGEPSKRRIGPHSTFADLVDLHISDLKELGHGIGRSKQAVMNALKRDLGMVRINKLDRTGIIKYGKMRARQGAGPVTLSVDLSYLHTVLTHAAAIHGIIVDRESVQLA